MITLSEQDVRRNTRALAHAIGQQELEGLQVPAATIVDLHRVARGEIDANEAIRNIYRDLQNVTLL